MNYGSITKFVDVNKLKITNLEDVVCQSDIKIISDYIDNILANRKLKERVNGFPVGQFNMNYRGRMFYVMNEADCFGFGFTLTPQSNLLVSSHKSQLIIEEFSAETQKPKNMLYIKNSTIIEKVGDKFDLKSSDMEL